jgi:hypothetical protein
MCLKAFFKPLFMKKLVYDTVDFAIALGDQAFSDSKDLRTGNCVGVSLIEYSETVRANGISVSIESTDGSAILGSKTDYRDFKRAGGSYIESFKPCSFRTDAQIRVDLLSQNAIAGTVFSGQLVFMIEVECSN